MRNRKANQLLIQPIWVILPATEKYSALENFSLWFADLTPFKVCSTKPIPGSEIWLVFLNFINFCVCFSLAFSNSGFWGGLAAVSCRDPQPSRALAFLLSNTWAGSRMSAGCCHRPSHAPSSVRNWKQTGFSKERLCGNTATHCFDLVFIQDPKSSHSYPHALKLLSWRCHENNLPHDFLLFHAFSLDGKLLWEQPLLVISGTCLVFVAALCCVWHRFHAQGPVMGTVEKTGLKWFWILNDVFQADGARLCHCSVALCVLHFTAWGHQPSFALILILLLCLLLFLWGCVFQAITIHVSQFWYKTSNAWLVSAKRHFTAALAEIAENR